MQRLILTLLISIIVMVTTGCGYHLRNSTKVPAELQTIILDSVDPYGPMTRTIREQLRLSNVKLVNNSKQTDFPSLRITGTNEKKETASIFANGVAAEYQMTMTVSAQLLLPNKDLYPIQVTVFRSFFDNPLAALAKDAEQEVLRQEMRVQAAQQLVRKLLTVHAAEISDKQRQTQQQENRTVEQQEPIP